MDDIEIKRANANAAWNVWNPPPLVIGTSVFSWTKWEVILRVAAETPGAAHTVFQRDDGGPDIVLRDPVLSGQVDDFLQEGTPYTMIGLCDEYVEANAFIPSFIGTFAFDNKFRCNVLSEHTIAMDLAQSMGSGLSRVERERRKLLVHYYRELYFWGFIACVIFSSEEEKQKALFNIRRDANDVAVHLCKLYFGFNAEKYRDNHLPRLTGNVKRT